jgi:hypothetical protein
MNYDDLNIINALSKLRPGAKFAVINGKMDWQDEEQTLPTEEELTAKAAEITLSRSQNEYKNKRKAEYPPIADFADAWVKQDDAALEVYRQKCLDVKAKYPKPSEE